MANNGYRLLLKPVEEQRSQASANLDEELGDEIPF